MTRKRRNEFVPKVRPPKEVDPLWLDDAHLAVKHKQKKKKLDVEGPIVYDVQSYLFGRTTWQRLRRDKLIKRIYRRRKKKNG